LRPVQECPVCGEPVKVGVAICRHCGAVLDEAKAARYGVPLRAVAPAPPASADSQLEGGSV